MSKNTEARAEIPAQQNGLPSWYGDLLSEIKGAVSCARTRAQRAANNFAATVPDGSDALKELVRDPYRLDFLGLDKQHAERELETAIVDGMIRFLTELGVGFAFVGRQYPVVIGGDEFRIDLLFYHLKLHRYFVFELKTKDVRPEHVGKLNFYVSVVDQMVREPERDDATIGFLIGARHNKAAVQLALDASNNPMAVASYSTLAPAERELIPTEEDLSRVVQEAIDGIEQAEAGRTGSP
ncbi:PDDEXK nuclease domain-containing protein [Streptomyces formicae]|uniref:Cytoplasmic protein n=1 Tax=Streptomyces formicae TaxID=1616117 RepID=A0A291QD49_9ACTN|nr:PDDEXK nuclease domain-containing protein [Streptomyces formicae]ATL29508.1 Putative cytoplasmic protein [Streptomyces formicae]